MAEEEDILILQQEIVRLQGDVTALKAALSYKDSLLDQMQQMLLVPKKPRRSRLVRPETQAKRAFYKNYKDDPDVLEKLKRLIGIKDVSMLPSTTIKLFTDLLFETTQREDGAHGLPFHVF